MKIENKIIRENPGYQRSELAFLDNSFQTTHEMTYSNDECTCDEMLKVASDPVGSLRRQLIQLLEKKDCSSGR